MQEHCRGIEASISKIFKKGPLRFELKKLPNFGTALEDGGWNFEWPKAADLEKLGLEEPLQLKAIKTKGRDGWVALRIQFVF